MPLFSLERQVEYACRYHLGVYRSRIFWVSKDGLTALAIPEFISGYKVRKPYNQKKLTRSWSKVDQFEFADGVKHILNEPPIKYHHLKMRSPTRVKIIEGYHSYVHYNSKFILNLDPRYTKNLPMPYYGQYIKTCYFCENGPNYKWTQNRYGD